MKQLIEERINHLLLGMLQSNGQQISKIDNLELSISEFLTNSMNHIGFIVLLEEEFEIEFRDEELDYRITNSLQDLMGIIQREMKLKTVASIQI